MENIMVDRHGNHRCVECERFVSATEKDAGRPIKHARHCESQAQPERSVVAGRTTASQLAQAVRAARQGAVSAVLSDEEIVKAVKNHEITVSDAMNRDF